ncbi:hypothetical protein MJN69_30575, partial [Salmonella enterica subsp. enterica serovar Kentucky]|nr:hypothetical protein [Salmonella enterica subsp. enterica serovar Kentucky]
VLGFGPTVLLPLVLFFLALFFKVKPAKALRSSLIVGIGFVGISGQQNSVAQTVPRRTDGSTCQRAEEPYGLLLYREKTYS